ncbi:MAG: sensor histidine kinase [Nitrospinales bacterium]
MKKKPLHILITDDDEDDFVFVSDLLRDALGTKVKIIDHAASYAAAIEILGHNSYDVALVDYRLDEANGIALLREIRSKGDKTPVIFLTGQGDQEVAVEAMKSGATDYLDKAKLSEDALAQSIRYAVELHAKEQELEKAQSVLLRNEKLTSIGTLCAGVAHEILNPLNIIGTIIQLERLNGLPESTMENLNKMLGQVKRATKITNNLRMFAHQKKDELGFVDIHKLFDESATLIEHDLNLDNIVINRVYDENLPKIYADEDKLAQVFLNLLNNARDAMENRTQNTITIQTKAMKHCVEIRFSDNGPGIAPDIVNKIFDPFFTTKKPGKGTGLGLSLIHSIIENRGGTIHVKSKMGKGTTFIIKIPVEIPANEKHAQEQPRQTMIH